MSWARNARWFYLLVLLVVVVPVRAGDRTPLDDYVAKPDSSYTWKLIRTIKGNGVTTYIVDLTSQTWLTQKEVDRPLWKHWLTIVKPDVVKYDKALIFIGGGKNGGEPPQNAGERTALIATATQSVVAELGMIPNQTLTFFNDGKKRVEDDLIAYCWIKFMETRDPIWLPRLPMVKSVVRAMDVVTELLGGEQGGKVDVSKFVIAGGSKRGWTTWLTGAADKRVVAIIPIVIDVLNVGESMKHHWRAYGFWAPAIGDYSRHKVHRRYGTPEYAELLKIVDPYSYRDRLTMPKFIINAAGDEFFLPDNSQFYFDELQGPKYLRYVPNANHSLKGTDAVESLVAFYSAILRGAELPKFAWKVEKEGILRVSPQTKPLEVNLWQATNPKARDFRLVTLGPKYKKQSLSPTGDGTYLVSVEKPGEGWTAFFVELVFESGAKFPYKFTTPVYVVPDVLPFSENDFMEKGIKE